VNGFVDDELRALLRVPVSASRDGTRRQLVAWIDTAFNGGLAIPHEQIAELGLSKQSSAEAILADGRSVDLEMFACFVDRFGNTYETQVAASDGEHALLERCCCPTDAWTSTTRPERSNSHSRPNDEAQQPGLPRPASCHELTEMARPVRRSARLSESGSHSPRDHKPRFRTSLAEGEILHVGPSLHLAQLD
jgi:predicted aspartyl protease